ncbi:MAG TPA: helix-turn-helix transcriptional regulator [Candidatus Cybelea sp.]
MIGPGTVQRVRDFTCGDLLTVASAGPVSLHRYIRPNNHRCPVAEHEYPSNSLVFTDVGEWSYHGDRPASLVGPDFVVAGNGLAHYECRHTRGLANECWVVAIRNDVFDDGESLFPKAIVKVTPEMRAHRRAILRSTEDPQQLESLAFSLYDLVARAAAKGHTRTVDIRTEYAKRLIRDRASVPVTVESIANALHLSRFTFTRQFLAYTGTTPHEYLTSIRIERAKVQLLKTNVSVEEIGLTNGFGSISHFSSAFHRMVGVAPSAFRRIGQQA